MIDKQNCYKIEGTCAANTVHVKVCVCMCVTKCVCVGNNWHVPCLTVHNLNIK